MTSTYSSFEGLALGPNSDGMFDIVAANSAAVADNVLSLSYATSGALASGYDQGVYVALNISGTSTGGNATQRHAFATDISIAGAHTTWIGGGYIYIAGTGTGAFIYGLNIHIGECGTADYLVNLWLQRDSTNTSSLDAYILMSGHPATQSTDTVMYMQGTAPTYFLQLPSANANGFWTTNNPGAFTASRCIAVRAGSTTYWIPLCPAT